MLSLPRLTPSARATAIGIVIAAAALRLWNTDAGIPYAVGADEPQVMNRVSAMMKTGDFNPHFFDWPTLTFYLHLVVACLTFLAGAMRGAWSSLDQVSAPELYLTARQFSALLGAATVAVTFAAARRWGTGVALAAAGLMAVLPPHVRESHYVLTDVPTSLFTVIALLMALRAFERQTTASWCWAGLAVGLAASCKYNGAIAVVMPVVAILAAGGGAAVMLSRLLIVGGMLVAGFLAGTPYAVLDLPTFLNDYARLAANFARERGGDPGWSIYLKHLVHSMAWPAFLAALAGGVVAVRDGVLGPSRAGAWMLLAFAATYFTVMARSYQIYGRYMLPLYPVLCILAAIAIGALVRRVQRVPGMRDRRRWVAAAAVIAVLAVPVVRAVDFNVTLGRPSTVDLAVQWLYQHAPQGSKVAIEAGALHLPPQFATLGVHRLTQRNREDYLAEGVRYLLAASPEFQNSLLDPNRDRAVHTAYLQLLGGLPEVAAFEPGPTVAGPAIRIFELVK